MYHKGYSQCSGFVCYFCSTHWGRVTHICVGKLTIISSDNGLSPGRRQAIIRTNAGILLIEPLGTKFSEILIGMQIFSFKKMRLKMSSAKRQPFCLGLNVLIETCLYRMKHPQPRQGCFAGNKSVTTQNETLTHGGHLTIYDSDNGLSPGRYEAIIWTKAGILLTEPLETNPSENLIGINKSSFTKMH